ncbi:hypothetical protein [Chroococcidiopsis sp. TS-821]|uniref:hypothetical protein n=1 Tax=Chroococcidiopsis sp. TS-821 TaxID=1378066 RepID=UPI000CEDD9A0|nr:hypothetical protein [Chroococcidiopsis sp. TS-821]PPS42322.1 hypothetical protein B1A85_14925 [Chroococcidiopsis sp. TS-821]
MNNTKNNTKATYEDWFNVGKSDAYAGKPKTPPEDAESASMYDLGYSEGEITCPPTETPENEE